MTNVRPARVRSTDKFERQAHLINQMARDLKRLSLELADVPSILNLVGQAVELFTAQFGARRIAGQVETDGGGNISIVTGAGFSATISGGDIDITFDEAFETSDYLVLATRNNTTALTSITTTSESTTGFTIDMRTSSSGSSVNVSSTAVKVSFLVEG